MGRMVESFMFGGIEIRLLFRSLTLGFLNGRKNELTGILHLLKWAISLHSIAENQHTIQL